MFPRSASAFVLASCLLAAGCMLYGPISSTAHDPDYTIKGNKVESLVDAITQLRQLLSSNLGADDRCHRYAIMLKSYRVTKGSMDNFELMKFAIMDKSRVLSEFAMLNNDLLRKLYIEGVKSFLDAKYVNAGTIDIYNCIKSKFSGKDAHALSFLNKENVQTIIGQYESIRKQPASLLDGEQHPDLVLESVDETVKNSVAGWLENGSADLGKLFRSASAPAARAQASYTQEPMEAATASSEAHSVTEQQPSASQLSEDEHNYLQDVFNVIVNIYETLPVETPHNERCRAYSKVVEASEDETFSGENFVNDLLTEVARRVPESDPEKNFEPDASERARFIFMLSYNHPDERSAEAWMDMLDCAEYWREIDQGAKEFLEGPQVAEIRASFEDDSDQETEDQLEAAGEEH